MAQVVIERSGAMVASQARFARSFVARLVGLLGRHGLGPGEALIFERCGSIHTIGMRFAIDAIFVDRAWNVVALLRALGPWRLIPPIRKAWAVLEVREDTVAGCGLKIGDRLRVMEGPSGGHG